MSTNVHLPSGTSSLAETEFQTLEILILNFTASRFYIIPDCSVK